MVLMLILMNYLSASVRNISEKQLSIINIDLPKRVGMRKLSDAIKVTVSFINHINNMHDGHI